MDFGIFMPSARNGYIVSEAAPQYSPSYRLMNEITDAGEENGFKFALSLVTLRGFGGPTRTWDDALESFTLMSALAPATENMRLYASVAQLTQHPAVIARMAMTIDDISGGRFGVNMVTGWQRTEFAAMGLWPGDEYYSTRYDYCREYVTIMKELWRDGVSSFKGRYFQLEDCRLGPLPEHHIEIVSAGLSDKGVEFIGEHADYSFRLGEGGLDGIAANTRKVVEAGRRNGREVGTHAAYYVFVEDTDEEARRTVERYRDAADTVAIRTMQGEAGADTAGTTAKAIVDRDGTFMSTDVIAGSPETVAAYFDRLAEIEGLDGVMLCFDDYVRGINRIGKEVAPLMKSRAAADPAGTPA
ncbi:MAG: LLM class flavin-dependent oxidoreductase [Actinobacteria bacterium]|nr:LLM class flavin-dependent oxidoreductase [Actinomycetota bacterium]